MDNSVPEPKENGYGLRIYIFFTMKFYHIAVFCGGVHVSISAVKHETQFFQALSRAIYAKLAGVHFMTKVYDGGILLESNTIPDSFLGTTLSFLYQNRLIELRVYPETLSES